MTAPALIRKADAARLLGGARASGYKRARLTLDPRGNIVLDAWDDDDPPAEGGENPLDRLLKQP